MKNILIGQSGGPTAVINSSLYGAVMKAYETDPAVRVYGMVNGMEGFLKGHYLDFADLKKNEELEKLLHTPGAFLGSCRYKLPEDLTDPVYPEILERLDELQIGFVCYIGGNDSMDTVDKLSRYAAAVDSKIRFIGIPKTIDNDLVQTDHTPGYGSAARYVANTVKEIIYDAEVYDSKSVTIIEIMGRHAGWLTAAAVMAREENGNPCLIYLPEAAFDLDRFLEDVKKELETTQNLVICVSEGIRDQEGKFICEYDSQAGLDSFGHKMLAGSAKYLENYIREHLDVKVRSVELNVCQRCSASYMSYTDQQEAMMAGAFGAEAAFAGETGKMVTFQRVKEYEIRCGLQDVHEICNLEKTFPKEWITANGNDIGQEFISYVRPLMKGGIQVPENENGISDFLRR